MDASTVESLKVKYEALESPSSMTCLSPSGGGDRGGWPSAVEGSRESPRPPAMTHVTIRAGLRQLRVNPAARPIHPASLDVSAAPAGDGSR